MQSFDNILELATANPQIKAYFFDMWGCLFDGEKFYDGALETLIDLREQNKIIYIITNVPISEKSSESTFANWGLLRGIHYTHIITSGQVAHDLLRRNALTFKNGTPKTYLEMGIQTDDLGAGTGLQKVKTGADCCIVGFPGFNDSEYNTLPNKKGLYRYKEKFSQYSFWLSDSPDVFASTLQKYKELNLPLLSANPDLSAPVICEDGRIRHMIMHGTVIAEYRKLGGEVIEIGKPSKEVFQYALDKLKDEGIDARPSETLMIGDTIRTDGGAVELGIKFALVIGDGGIIGQELSKGAKLEDLIKRDKFKPDFLLQKVAKG